MYQNCVSLSGTVKIPKVKKLHSQCFYNMFNNCRNITTISGVNILDSSITYDADSN